MFVGFGEKEEDGESQKSKSAGESEMSEHFEKPVKASKKEQRC